MNTTDPNKSGTFPAIVAGGQGRESGEIIANAAVVGAVLLLLASWVFGMLVLYG